MKFFILFLLFFKVNSFLMRSEPIFLNKYKIEPLSNLYEIKPHNTIIYYDLSYDHKINIQNDINEKTNDRFEIKNDNIYLSLHDYVEDDKVMSVCQIFVYVHDNKNNLDGQYILESKNYGYVLQPCAETYEKTTVPRFLSMNSSNII